MAVGAVSGFGPRTAGSPRVHVEDVVGGGQVQSRAPAFERNQEHVGRCPFEKRRRRC